MTKVVYKRGNKYGAKPVTVGDDRWDSKKEYNRWQFLRYRELAGEITDLERQPRFTFKKLEYLTGKNPIYIADFRYYENGQVVVEDVKGGTATQTDAFRLKWALMKHFFGIEVRVV